MENFHPISASIFLISMVICIMLINNPLYLCISLVGTLMLFYSISKKCFKKEILFYIVTFAVVAIINPIFTHKGNTPLFFLNGRAITYEALIYGIYSSLSLVISIILCRCFSIVMTSDKIICIVGRFSPKMAAIISLIIRFIPEMISQGGKFRAFQRVYEANENPSAFNKVRMATETFSALITWSIENAVQTSNAMKARGFDLKGRINVSSYRFGIEDIIITCFSIVTLIIAALSVQFAEIKTVFYPELSVQPISGRLIIITVSTAATFIFPLLFTLWINQKKKKACLS